LQQDEPSQQVLAPKALIVKANIKATPVRAELSRFIVFLHSEISNVCSWRRIAGPRKQVSLNQKDMDAEV